MAQQKTQQVQLTQRVGLGGGRIGGPGEIVTLAETDARLMIHTGQAVPVAGEPEVIETTDEVPVNTREAPEPTETPEGAPKRGKPKAA